MATKERAAQKAISEATEQLERLHTHSISTDDEPAKRGPGRPPKALVSLEQAEQVLKASLRGIGHAYHFVDVRREAQ